MRKPSGRWGRGGSGSRSGGERGGQQIIGCEASGGSTRCSAGSRRELHRPPAWLLALERPSDEEREGVTEMPAEKGVPAHALAPGPCHLPHALEVRQEISGPGGKSFHQLHGLGGGGAEDRRGNSPWSRRSRASVPLGGRQPEEVDGGEGGFGVLQARASPQGRGASPRGC